MAKSQQPRRPRPPSPHQLAGSALRPRSTKVGRHSGFSALSSRRSGSRRSKVEIAISASMPRQLGAEAKMDAAAKGQRPHIGTGDIEAYPAGRDRPPGRDWPNPAGTARFRLSGFSCRRVLDVFQRHPAGHLHRGVVTQEFLDRIGDEARIGLEQRELIRDCGAAPADRCRSD